MNNFIKRTIIFRCKIPSYENDTYAIQDEQHLNLINSYIPSANAGKDYDQCHMYLYNWDNGSSGLSHSSNNGTKRKCSEWVYSHDVFRETFTSKVCSV